MKGDKYEVEYKGIKYDAEFIPEDPKVGLFVNEWFFLAEGFSLDDRGDVYDENGVKVGTGNLYVNGKFVSLPRETV